MPRTETDSDSVLQLQDGWPHVCADRSSAGGSPSGSPVQSSGPTRTASTAQPAADAQQLAPPAQQPAANRPLPRACSASLKQIFHKSMTPAWAGSLEEVDGSRGNMSVIRYQQKTD